MAREETPKGVDEPKGWTRHRVEEDLAKVEKWLSSAVEKLKREVERMEFSADRPLHGLSMVKSYVQEVTELEAKRQVLRDVLGWMVLEERLDKKGEK